MNNRGQIEEIKSKLNLVDVVRGHVGQFKKSGRNHFACCPFHSEKTPSFSVNEDIQRYKCFGCGESGDVINFIEKIEGIDFPRALEIAAKKAGVKLAKSSYKQDKFYEEKKRILEANRVVAEYFHYILTKHKKGELGKKYARMRKFSKSAVTDFLIGYAPAGFENLKTFMVKKGYKLDDLVNWSLLTKKNNRVYDKFRNRLMFPIFNHLGDIIGFSGRVIDNNDIPKYLNSSETPVYKKSDVLYGLFQGKDAIRRSRTAIVVEGNVDIPTAHRKGIKNVVAPMGTALTQKQLKLLNRYADKVFFAFDSDLAGEKALIRSFELAEQLGIESKSIDMGKFGDLDEYLNNDPKAAKSSVENAMPVIEHIIARKLKKVDMADAKSKSRFLGEIIPLFKYVKDEVEKTHYVQRLADVVSVDEKLIWKRLEGKNSNTPRATSNTDTQSEEVAKIPEYVVLPAEEEHIAFLLQFPALRSKTNNFEYLSNQELIEVYKDVIGRKNMRIAIDKLNDRFRDIISDLYSRKLGDFESDHEIEGYFAKLGKRIETDYLKRELELVKQEIKLTEDKGEDIGELLKKQMDLIGGLVV